MPFLPWPTNCKFQSQQSIPLGAAALLPDRRCQAHPGMSATTLPASAATPGKDTKTRVCLRCQPGVSGKRPQQAPPGHCGGSSSCIAAAQSVRRVCACCRRHSQAALCGSGEAVGICGDAASCAYCDVPTRTRDAGAGLAASESQPGRAGAAGSYFAAAHVALRSTSGIRWPRNREAM
jgi:hypothetical protein